MADKLYLIRHGRTALNKEGRLRAHKDVPLDDVGKRDARLVAGKLVKLDPTIDCLYCSDLKRSYGTAKPISDALNAPIEVRPELRPWHLGSLAGQKVSSILPLLEWYSAHPEKVVTGGEAYNDFFKRWVKYLRHQIGETKAKKYPDAVITHARHMLSLDAALDKIRGRNVDTASIPASGGPQPASVICIDLKTLKWKQLIAGQGETAKVS